MEEIVAICDSNTSTLADNKLKRLIDIIGSITLMTLSAPLLLIIAWIIRRDGGSSIYYQERIGYGGKPFKCYKFRSMVTDASTVLNKYLAENPQADIEWKTHFKLKNDPRITPVIGDFIRKTSIDELPQLWNILKGDMSFVGPRPFPKYHLDSFSSEFQELRQQVPPGLTGLWQVCARSDGDISVQERLDRQYTSGK